MDKALILQLRKRQYIQLNSIITVMMVIVGLAIYTHMTWLFLGLMWVIVLCMYLNWKQKGSEGKFNLLPFMVTTSEQLKECEKQALGTKYKEPKTASPFNALIILTAQIILLSRRSLIGVDATIGAAIAFGVLIFVLIFINIATLIHNMRVDKAMRRQTAQ